MKLLRRERVQKASMDAILDWVAAFAGSSPLLFVLLFVLAFVNAFLPPVPIETISVFAGYLSQMGNGNAFGIVLALSLGVAAGSAVLFLLARSQGRRLLQVGFVQRQVTPTRLEKTETWFRRYGMWMIFAGKLIPGMSFVTVVSSGLFRMGKRQALIAIYLANFLYFAATVALGQLLGEEWRSVTRWGRAVWPYILAAAVAVAAIVGVRALLRRRVAGS